MNDAMDFVMLVKLFKKQKTVKLPVKLISKKMRAKSSVLQQETSSSICLEANDKRSSTKRTSYINIRYFYGTNKVRSGDVVIVYHPIGKFVGDYLTKPLNRIPFKNHYNMIIKVDDNAMEN